MSTTVEAVYEDGKLVLQQPLPLPEKARVRVTIEAEDSLFQETDRAAWLRLSEKALMKAWDNAADDVFNELLAK